jgi:hypothetical protein
MYKRIFAFGCSYTNYVTPTWANIIAYDLQLPFENWALSGTGNFAIQSRLVECDYRRSLNNDDLVMILWSGWNREDRFNVDEGGWLRGGYIFNNPHYDKHFLDKYWTLENDIVRNMTVLHTTRRAYKDVIKFEGEKTSPFYGDEYNPEVIPKNKENYISSLLREFEKRSPKIPKFDDLEQNEWHEVFNDAHPNVLQHLEFVIKNVYPKLNLEINKDTVEKSHLIHNEILNFKKNNMKMTGQELHWKIRSIAAQHGMNLTTRADQYVAWKKP